MANLESQIKNMGLPYDPDAKTFMLDDDLWNEMTKVISTCIYVNLYLLLWLLCWF